MSDINEEVSESPRGVARAEEPRKTRRSRFADGGGDFDVPAKYLNKGMSFVWWAISVVNQPVDSSKFVTWADGGWEPVRPNSMPELMPAGIKSQTIDRKGLRLFQRPTYLEDEARAEDLKIAIQQKEAKLAQAMATPNESAPRTGNRLDLGIGPGVKD